MTRVAIVGSANLDVVVSVERFPRGGETILGDHLEEVPGGKGLNQAIAAGAGSACAFVGCIGDDDAGRLLLEHLQTAGVDTTHVLHTQEPTGRAFIQVTPDGENSIVVMPLANRLVEGGHVHDALEELRPSVVLAQLEIPMEAVGSAMTWTAARGARFILNASPVRDLAASLLERCDPLVVNAGEAGALLRSGGSWSDTSADGVEELARRLVPHVRSLVVTDGAGGVYVGNTDGVAHIPAQRVTAVDTTGAGDAFAGTLASALAQAHDLHAAAGAANEAAAAVVQVPRARR